MWWWHGDLVLTRYIKNIAEPSTSYALLRGCCNQGRIQGGRLGRSPTLKPTKVTFFTIILYNSENNIHDIRPFFRHLCYHTSVVKYTSSLLPQRSLYETWLPNITEITPLNSLAGSALGCNALTHIDLVAFIPTDRRPHLCSEL